MYYNIYSNTIIVKDIKIKCFLKFFKISIHSQLMAII